MSMIEYDEEREDMATGCGSTSELAEGGWEAVISLGGAEWLVGRGHDEDQALESLNHKCKALGNLVSAGFADAAGPRNAKISAENAKLATRLKDLLAGKGFDLSDLVAEKKDPGGDKGDN